MIDSIERLSFELTTSALAEQERAVSSLRSCAGTVLGAASVAGSFLGSRFAARSSSACAVLAIVAFALCVGTAIWVLIPRSIALAVDGDELMADGEGDARLEIDEVYRAAARWTRPQVELNRRKINPLADWLTVSCGLLAVEIVVWTISLIG
jgi:hypothetical protein